MTQEEFLFPDSEPGTLPEKLRFATPQDGKRGIQLLLPSAGSKAVCSLISEDFMAEWYEMEAVPVEYNTGNSVTQGGSMVIMEPVKEKPSYTIKKAPFQVYNCLVPCQEGITEVKDGKAAICICLVPKEKIHTGTCPAEVRAMRRII